MPRIAKSEQDKHLEIIADRVDHAYRDAIRKRGLASDDAAKSLGLSRRVLNERVSNPRDFRLGELMNIANVLNIKFETLIARSGGAYE